MEHNLAVLIKEMQPKLEDEIYVFCTLTYDTYMDPSLQAQIRVMVREVEGLSIVIPKHTAQAYNLAYTFESAMITLEVYSDLAAVGLTAVVAQALYSEGISCNVVAAYHHDHLFVPIDKGRAAIDCLSKLSASVDV